jgi:hypothetical protein
MVAVIRLGGTPQAALDPLWGVGFDDALESPSGLAAALSAAQAGNWAHPLHVRLAVRRSTIEPVPGTFDFSALDARLAEYRRVPAVDVYLDLRGPAPAPDAMNDWTRFVRAPGRAPPARRSAATS